MQSNNNQNLFKNSYKDYYYWENKIITDSQLWEGYFNNEKITADSKIIYTGILNAEKNVLECGFIAHPSIYSVLGFMQHVFLQTAFFTWFDTSLDQFCVPLATLDTFICEIAKDNKNIDIHSLNSIKECYDYLNTLWEFNEDELTINFKNFSDNFNDKWDNDPQKKLFIKIFDSPIEIYHFITETIGWDFDEFVQEELSVSLEVLQSTCGKVLAEPLINRRFIDILNTQIPILF